MIDIVQAVDLEERVEQLEETVRSLCREVAALKGADYDPNKRTDGLVLHKE